MAVTIKFKNMEYKGYIIEPDNSGYAPKSMMFGIFKEVEECKKLIDEDILENSELTDKNQNYNAILEEQ